VLGELHRDPSVDLLDGSDRNGDLLASPEVAFLQQHMRDMSLGGVDDEARDLADLTITRMDRLAAPDADLPRREHVARLDGAGQRQLRICPTFQAEVRPVIRLVCGVGVVAAAARKKVRLLGGRELLELGEGVPQADVASLRLDHLERDQAAQAAAVLRLND
jgi:hypothetical protein